MIMQFIPMSDTHFHEDSVKNTDMDTEFIRLDILFPDVRKIISGDITHNGYALEYAYAANRIKETDIVCPGNHDECTKGSWYNFLARWRFEKTFHITKWPHITTFESEKIIIITLDSVCHTINPLDFACGKIGYWQLKRLDNILTKYQGWFILVAFHHHPWYHYNPTMKLIDADQLLAVCKNRVDVFSFGHKHEKRLYQNKDGIRFAFALGKASEPLSKWLFTISGKDILYKEI